MPLHVPVVCCFVAQVDYNGETQTFSSTQVLAMLLTGAKKTVAFQNPGVQSVDACVSVPAYFTEEQRRAVKDACSIAGINCLRLLNEGTAAALSYGIFKGAKKEFPEGTKTQICFLDMGASQFTATIAAFTNTSLEIRASVSDSDLGGRDLDVAIAKYFAATFKEKTGHDAWKSKKARVKLMMAAEKAKISISPHGVNHTPVSIECLMEDRDLSTELTAEKLDELMGSTVSARVGAVVKAALAQAGCTSYQDFASVELCGGSMRPRLVKRAAAIALGMPLDEATGHGLSQSMNLDEAGARGCALQCAMLSVVFKVKPFEITDRTPYQIRVSFDPLSGAEAAESHAAGDAMEQDEEGGAQTAQGESSVEIFKLGAQVPGNKKMTIKRDKPFTLTAENVFDDVPVPTMVPAGSPSLLSKYLITGFPADAIVPGQAAPKIRVEFRHDLDGLFSVVSAQLMKEIKEDTPVASPPPAGAAAEAKEGDAKMDVEGGAAAAAGEPAKKKRFRPVALKFESHPGSGMDAASLQAAIEQEKKMMAADAEVRATQDMRNSLEAYIYATRSGIEDTHRPYSTEAERDSLNSALSAMEDWLYNEGFEADKATYAAKLKELQSQGNPIAARKWEADNRYNAMQALEQAINDFRAVQMNATGKHGHLSDADKDTLRAATSEAEDWFRTQQMEQGKRELFQDPVVRVADIVAAKDRLIKELTPIANRPVPAPAPVPAAPPAADAAPMDAEPAAAAAPEATAGDVPPPAPAETDAKME